MHVLNPSDRNPSDLDPSGLDPSGLDPSGLGSADPSGLGSPPSAKATFNLVVGWIAVAGMLPYLVIKTFWLCGSTIGIIDVEALDTPTIEAINGATFGMEAVAVVVALALTRPWGMRLPAWLVAFPVWIAAGFLVPRITAIPFSGLLVRASEGSSDADPLIETWVYVVVSLGFAVQGIALLVAFVSYCHTRWRSLLLQPTAERRTGATHPFQIVAVRGTTVLIAVIVAFHVLAVIVATPHDRAWLIANGLNAVLWITIAVVGAFMLTRQLSTGRRLWLPLAMVWIGTGAMVWWGVFDLIVRLTDSAIASDVTSPLADIATLGGVCTGLVLALVAAFLVAEGAERAPGAPRPGRG